MKLFWALLYNVFFYPFIFLLAILGSIFQEKLRTSIVGRFRSIPKLKYYFRSLDSNPKIYWFHASSLGEFYQVKPVIELSLIHI